jgi:hypothetical protein
MSGGCPAPRLETQSLRIFCKDKGIMSKCIDKSSALFVSVENSEHDRCVDIFSRPDGSYGFEEFRRDIEDGGQWTPMQYYSGVAYVSSAAALDTAERCVTLAGRHPRAATGTANAYPPESKSRPTIRRKSRCIYCANHSASLWEIGVCFGV